MYFIFLSLVPLHQVTLASLPAEQALALQNRALNMISDIPPNVMDNLVNIYQLGSVDATIVLSHINRLQALNYYKEVSVCPFLASFFCGTKTVHLLNIKIGKVTGQQFWHRISSLF